jgi:hypothetical protein
MVPPGPETIGSHQSNEKGRLFWEMPRSRLAELLLAAIAAIAAAARTTLSFDQ